MLTHLPDQTTEILVELCTGTLSARNADDHVQSPTPSAKNNNTSALQTLSILPFATANESASIRSDSSGTNRDTSIDTNEKQQHKGSLKYSPPSARIFMPAFVERPNYLVVLLESVYEKRWAHLASGNDKTNNDSGSIRSYSTREDKTIHQPNGANTGPTLSHQEKEERKAIWNTLLELYLMDEQPLPLASTSSREQSSDEERQKRRKNFRVKALALLKDQSVDYDTNQALVLCQLKQFDEGIVYLYEKTGMYSDIVQFWIDKEETDRVIDAVRKYGSVFCYNIARKH